MRPDPDQLSRLPWRAFAVALIGISLLLATPLLNFYSYTVASVSSDAKEITISYIYPLLPLLPSFLVSGLTFGTLGLWYARKVLVAHKSIAAILGWLAIAVGSGLAANWLADVITPFLGPPLLLTAEVRFTPEYATLLILYASTIAALSGLGVWMTTVLLRTLRKSVILTFGLGVLATLVSLIWSSHVIGVSFEQYQRGFPLPWLVLSDGMSVASGWFPNSGFIFDLLFWSALAYGSLLLATRIRTRLARSNQVGPARYRDTFDSTSGGTSPDTERVEANVLT